MGEQNSQDHADDREKQRLTQLAPDNLFPAGAQDGAHPHLFDPASRQGRAQIDVVENSRQKQEQNDGRKDLQQGQVPFFETTDT